MDVNTNMISLMTPSKAQIILAEQARARRLEQQLTQEGLAMRSGVALATLRKFERTGNISLASFLKIHMVLGGIEDVVRATQVKEQTYSSIDEVLKADRTPHRKRGTRK
jgi:Helix-turn-helix.